MSHDISVTPAAAEQMKKSMSTRGRGVGIRVGVRTSGCSGMAYRIEYVDTPNADDVVVETNGVKLFIDLKSLPYLSGMRMDYVRKGLGEGFSFENPNVRTQCGCGESFSV